MKKGAVEETLYGDITNSGTSTFLRESECGVRDSGAIRTVLFKDDRIRTAASTVSDNPRRTLLAQLMTVYQEADAPNWDGEDSAPVTGPAKEWGRRFANSVPLSVPDPSVSIDRKGYVNFDWEHDDDIVAAIVDVRGVVYYIAFVRGNHSRGRINDFSSQFPKPLMDELRRMLNA